MNMGDRYQPRFSLPPEQQSIRDKCFHPSGAFVEFSKEDVETSIPERFEKIVRLYRHCLAIETPTESLTYAELNNSANRLARRILAVRGCGAEAIAVLVNKKTALVRAILAILKAGKFVVLLDPSFPKARTSGMLEDCQARVVVADRENIVLGTELLGPTGEILNLELDAPDIFAEEDRLSIDSKDLAFVFYTSGSTGDPKGVMQTHRNILHNLMLRMTVYNVSHHDRISLLASGTSNAVINMFLAVLNGAALLPFDVQKEGVASLANWLAREKISICFISGPLFRRFHESLSGYETFPHLRALRLTSEAIYETDVDIYKKILSPECVLVNGLSSSETGPLSKYVIDRNTKFTKFAGTDVPVGFALPDKEVFLVDDSGDRVRANEVGEIVVRSRYLSPGYWRRPELTQMKFRADPNEQGVQLYFTGDLGIMLSDGCLIHKGRKDFRVKIRGYGVETREVERALLEHPTIKEAIVTAQRDVSGGFRLVAYVVFAMQPVPTTSELRAFLQTKLPDYMIPGRFVQIDAIPLTPAGKIDRRLLPDPGTKRPELATSFVEPRTDIEQQLASIWAEVLNLDQVGSHDNFFDLGGDSLAINRVVSRVIQAFQLELPVKALFESPTIAEMTKIITHNQVRTAGPQVLERMLSEIEALSDDAADQACKGGTLR